MSNIKIIGKKVMLTPFSPKNPFENQKNRLLAHKKDKESLDLKGKRTFFRKNLSLGEARWLLVIDPRNL